jgi:hypothetical protein
VKRLKRSIVGKLISKSGCANTFTVKNKPNLCKIGIGKDLAQEGSKHINYYHLFNNVGKVE